MLLKIIGIVFVLVWIWLFWEMHNAPVMPDDYDISETDIDDKYKESHKKQSHGKLGGNLEDVHMKGKKNEWTDEYKQPWKRH